LPGVPGSGAPDHGLPPFPSAPIYIPPLPPGYPDNSLPPIASHPIAPPPVYPSLPIYPVPPGTPTHPIEPPPPGAVWPPLPPTEEEVVIAIVGIPGAGWFYVALDPNAKWPAQGMPGPQPPSGGDLRPDNSLPGQPGHPANRPPGQGMPPRPDQGLPPMAQPKS
jgi:hypothetical protein